MIRFSFFSSFELLMLHVVLLYLATFVSMLPSASVVVGVVVDNSNNNNNTSSNSVMISCGQSNNGDITIDGSPSGVPLATAWAKHYQRACNNSHITVTSSSSQVGAQRVCAVATAGSAVDIGILSRPFLSNEATSLPITTTTTTSSTTTTNGFNYKCAQGNTSRTAIQLEIAVDVIVLVVARNGSAAYCLQQLYSNGLTLEQLRLLYSNYTVAQLLNITTLSPSNSPSSSISPTLIITPVSPPPSAASPSSPSATSPPPSKKPTLAPSHLPSLAPVIVAPSHISMVPYYVSPKAKIKSPGRIPGGAGGVYNGNKPKMSPIVIAPLAAPSPSLPTTLVQGPTNAPSSVSPTPFAPIPTLAPALVPTFIPVVPPTFIPVVAPTFFPIRPPTFAPVRPPTFAPVKAPIPRRPTPRPTLPKPSLRPIKWLFPKYKQRVGGAAADYCSEIQALVAGPPTTSEIYQHFVEKVLPNYGGDENVTPSYYNAASVDEIVSYLQNHTNAIAFFSRADYAANKKNVMMVSVSNKNGKNYLPNTKSINAGRYPLVYDVYMDARSDDVATLGALRPFFAFAYSPQGRADVSSTGLIPVPDSVAGQMLSRLNASNGFH